MEIFHGNSYPLEALTIVVNISVDIAGVLDPRLTTVYYTKAILTSLKSEF